MSASPVFGAVLFLAGATLAAGACDCVAVAAVLDAVGVVVDVAGVDGVAGVVVVGVDGATGTDGVVCAVTALYTYTLSPFASSRVDASSYPAIFSLPCIPNFVGFNSVPSSVT